MKLNVFEYITSNYEIVKIYYSVISSEQLLKIQLKIIFSD